jgi:hypothetical protein
MVKNKLSNSDYSILYFKPGKEPNDSILSHDQAFALFSSISSSSQEIQGKHQGLYAFYKNSETENWKKSISHQKKYLEEIIKLCEKEKIEVYFLYVPMKNFFSRKGFLGSAKTHTDENFYKKNPHYRMINTICESNKIKCFFANDFFVNKIPEILYFPLNGSLNREGHKVLFEYLNKSFPK